MGPRPLEGAPGIEQKRRLQGWLKELMRICRQFDLLLDTDDGDARIIDLRSGTIIGLGVTALTDHADPETITAYDCAGSILDGVWLVDTDTGPREQRDVTRVLPPPGPSA